MHVWKLVKFYAGAGAVSCHYVKDPENLAHTVTTYHLTYTAKYIKV